jgi:hypothetical protein
MTMKTSGTQAFVNQLLVGLLVTIGFGGTIGLGTVWMRHRISVVADNNADLRRQIAEIDRRITDVSALVEEAKSEDILRSQNDSMHLGLVAMTQTQIQPVPVDPVARLVARANRRIFARESAEGGIGIQLNFDSPPTTALTNPAVAMPAVNSTTPPAQPATARAPKLQFALNP